MTVLSDKEWVLLEEWLADETFVGWANGEDEESVAMWEKYLNRSPGHWKVAKVGRTLIQGVPFANVDSNDRRRMLALANLNRRLDRHKGRTQPVVKVVQKNRMWFKVAAAGMFLIAATGIYWHYFYDAQITIATNFGEQLRHDLPDGSAVSLNANSKLTYSKLSPRRVKLEGEAFFEVERKPISEAKFRVITNDLEIIVLGTTFNVNARNDKTKVFLEEGRVDLEAAGGVEKIVMEPGDLITYSKKNRELLEKRNDASALKTATWKEGALIFKDTPLLEALFEIEDIYGIQFIIQSESLKKLHISGGVPIKNLKVTLSTLTEVYGMELRKEGKRYFVGGSK
ncbi:MAG: hypothetical protein HKN87_04615 [Saprospiraceae bacterium]|nr:hypothetical protein [Saprospiraceae bacterium]